jgi:hypothetical protein
LETNPSSSAQIVADAISKEMVQVGTVHLNVAQEYIMITEDKTYRCLSEWKERIEQRNSWIAPVSLLASLTMTFVTATFKDAMAVPKETWEAVFIISIVGSVLWVLRELIKLRPGSRDPTVEELITKLKKGAAVVQTTSYQTTQTEAKTSDN